MNEDALIIKETIDSIMKRLKEIENRLTQLENTRSKAVNFLDVMDRPREKKGLNDNY